MDPICPSCNGKMTKWKSNWGVERNGIRTTGEVWTCPNLLCREMRLPHEPAQDGKKQ